MNYERSILITFLGNYLTNNVIAAIVALLPVAATAAVITPQYIVYVVLAALLVAVLAWWARVRTLKTGAIFGLVGFLVALITAFVTGFSGVMMQTGSFFQALQVIPNFWPFLMDESTLVLLGYWVIPSVIIGYVRGRSMSAPVSTI